MAVIKIMKFMNNTASFLAVCYFCDEITISMDHVPPRCLFPEQKDLDDGLDYRKNLIKVPSCDKHNSQKSTDDEYLNVIIAHNYSNNAAGQNHFKSKIIRATERKPALLIDIHSTAESCMLNNEIAPTVDADPRLYSILEKICQGLCVYSTGRC